MKKFLSIFLLFFLSITAMEKNSITRNEASFNSPVRRLLIPTTPNESPRNASPKTLRPFVRTDSTSPFLSPHLTVTEHYSNRSAESSSPHRGPQKSLRHKDLPNNASPRHVLILLRMTKGSPRSEAAFLKTFGDDLLQTEALKKCTTGRLARVISLPDARCLKVVENKDYALFLEFLKSQKDAWNKLHAEDEKKRLFLKDTTPKGVLIKKSPSQTEINPSDDSDDSQNNTNKPSPRLERSFTIS